jgi:LysR family hydrogen peroxide-inducible transcriptional activator
VELHQLRYFCAIVEAGNFTRAAQRTHVAQPSLSQQILKLEDELGAKLFDRLPRAVKLTPFGRVFLPKAMAILRQVGEARTEIQEMSGSERGTIVLGAIPTIAPYLLPRILSGFASEHPTIQVRVAEELTPVLLERLRAGSLDLALLALPIRGEEMLCEELFREPLYAVVPSSHRLALRTNVLLRDIKSDSFLLLKEGHCFRDNTISACQRSHLRPNIVFECGQFSSILAMVSAGMGVSVVPEMAVEKRAGCSFVPIRDSQAQRRVGFVQLKQHFVTRAQRAFIEHLKSRSGLREASGVMVRAVG